jgi:hypothetical protein
MTRSIFLARFLGLLILVPGLLMIVAPTASSMLLRALAGSDILLPLAGFVWLSIATTILMIHNLWTRDWRVIVTLMGWVMLFRGILVIVHPDWIESAVAALTESRLTLYAAASADVALGLLLFWLSSRRGAAFQKP